MKPMMKAILLTRAGGPWVLDYAEVPIPRLMPGEVLVQADTIGVSRPELLVRPEYLRFGVDGDLRIVMRETADSLVTMPAEPPAPATVPKLR